MLEKILFLLREQNIQYRLSRVSYWQKKLSLHFVKMKTGISRWKYILKMIKRKKRIRYFLNYDDDYTFKTISKRDLLEFIEILDLEL